VLLRVGLQASRAALMCWHSRLLSRRGGLHARRSAIGNKQRWQESLPLPLNATSRQSRALARSCKSTRSIICCGGAFAGDSRSRVHFKVSSSALKYVMQMQRRSPCRGSVSSLRTCGSRNRVLKNNCMKSKHAASQVTDCAGNLTLSLDVAQGKDD
jgi:hypothetical protein